jgi:hypothetical protein
MRTCRMTQRIRRLQRSGARITACRAASIGRHPTPVKSQFDVANSATAARSATLRALRAAFTERPTQVDQLIIAAPNHSGLWRAILSRACAPSRRSSMAARSVRRRGSRRSDAGPRKIAKPAASRRSTAVFRVIAYKNGSAPEVIDDGVSGYLVDDIPQAVEAVLRIDEFDRARARRCFERRFSIERVAVDYLDIYRSLPGLRRTNGRVRPEVGLPIAAPHIPARAPVPRRHPVLPAVALQALACPQTLLEE